MTDFAKYRHGDWHTAELCGLPLQNLFARARNSEIWIQGARYAFPKRNGIARVHYCDLIPKEKLLFDP